MRVSIINEDKSVVVNGIGSSFEFSLDGGIHAIQWDEDHGEIEYKDPSVPNEVITDFSPYQYLVDGLNEELLRLEAEAEAKEQARKDSIILVKDVYEEVKLETLWDRIRRERNGRLAITDWTQLPGAKLTLQCILAFADYRQELRDIPQTYQAPEETLWRANTTHWPEKPEEVKKI